MSRQRDRDSPLALNMEVRALRLRRPARRAAPRAAPRRACLPRAPALTRARGHATSPAPPPGPRLAQTALFCGRLPKGFQLAALQAAASAPPLPGGGTGYLPCLGASHCRATCVFLEFADAEAVAAASAHMNGAVIGGSHIIAVPAVTLSRLFIGNVSRACSAAAIREAIARVEPVCAACRVHARAKCVRACARSLVARPLLTRAAGRLLRASAA